MRASNAAASCSSFSRLASVPCTRSLLGSARISPATEPAAADVDHPPRRRVALENFRFALCGLGGRRWRLSHAGFLDP